MVNFRNVVLVAGTLFTSIFGSTCAFNIKNQDNVALYWGQNSARKAPQPPLREYCARDNVDIIILAFIAIFYGPEQIPVLNLATAQCSPFPGPSGQLNCPELAKEIAACRAKGKKVLVSLGGATSGTEVMSEAQAVTAATQIWNTFLGGGRNGRFQRPFGEVELDGIDLDREAPPDTYWPFFVDRMRKYYLEEPGRNGKRDYLITASPQCPYPDANLNAAFHNKRSWFDMLFIQFYNNYCDLTIPKDFNFNQWAEWARSGSLNPHVKLFLGAPANPAAASKGYVPLETLIEFATESMEDCENARIFWKGMGGNSTYNPFGGISFWDASWTAPEYTAAVKTGLTRSWESVKHKARGPGYVRRTNIPNDEAEESKNESSSEKAPLHKHRRFIRRRLHHSH